MQLARPHQPKGVTSLQTLAGCAGPTGEGGGGVGGGGREERVEARAGEKTQAGGGGGRGWRGGGQRQQSVLPALSLAFSESLAAFKNFTEEERAAPGRRLRSRGAATGVGCRQSLAGVDAVRLFSSCPALERLARLLSLRGFLYRQASSGPSASPSTLAPRNLRRGAGRWKANATVCKSGPAPAGPASLPSHLLPPSPPLFFSLLPSPRTNAGWL